MRGTEAWQRPRSRRRSSGPTSTRHRRTASRRRSRAAEMLTARISSDFDRSLFFSTVLLALIGIAFVYSATAMPAATTEHGLYLKQFLWLGLALAGGALAAAVPYRIYEGKTA